MQGPVSPAPFPTTPAAVTLALDTATPHLTLALSWAGGVTTWREEVGRAHAERLPAAVRALFAQADLPFLAGRIVIGTGPGSYTGVRVGASYALGLARAWGAQVPGVAVLGVRTLEGLVLGDGPQAVSLDARKGNVYGAVYDVSGGHVARIIHLPAKRSQADFQALIGDLPWHADPAPDGLALLRAGLHHGERDWALAYL